MSRLGEIRREKRQKAARRVDVAAARREIKRKRRELRRELQRVEAIQAEIAMRLELDEIAHRALEADDADELSPAERRRLESQELSRSSRANLETKLLEHQDKIDELGSRLVELADRRLELGDELAKLESAIRRLVRKAKRIRRRRARRRRRRNLDRVVAFDGTPVTASIALMLGRCRAHGWRGYVSSGNRQEGVAEKFGKMSQAALYRCWQTFASTGSCPCSSCNPANPPGRSTHELRDDGIYGGPAGRELEPWQLGVDATEADQLRAIAQELGFDLRRPYADAREQHHSNLFENPKRRLIELGVV